MIESIGYTDNGLVWVSMLVDWEGHHGKIVATFTPDQAVDIAGKFIKASDGARETANVRDSSNTH